MTADERGTAPPTADQQAVNEAWRRYGIAMETVQATWDRMAKRNFDFWKDVAGSLKSAPVTADTLAANTARAMAVAQETMEDLWLTAVEPPQREVYVQVLPTAFLFFDRIQASNEPDEYAGQDPVHIPVVRQRTGDLPETAEIALNGSSTRTDVDPADAVTALTSRLQVRLQPGTRSYLLETIKPANPVRLEPGTYDGVIYLIKPPLPLANLRIVVEGPPPVVDAES